MKKNSEHSSTSKPLWPPPSLSQSKYVLKCHRDVTKLKLASNISVNGGPKKEGKGINKTGFGSVFKIALRTGL